MIAGLVASLRAAFLARRGRPAAMVILVALLSANFASELSISEDARATVGGRLLETLSSPFASGRQLLFDSYQRLFPRLRQTQPVTIVEIDEASLKQVGQWPWPRNRLADLIDAIARHQPAAIGLDLYMPEPDQTSPGRVAANLPPGNERLAAALAALPSHEKRLAESLRAAPVVLGAAGFDFATFTTSAGLRVAPMRAIGNGEALAHVHRFPQVLASLPELQAAAAGQALLSISSDDTVVRHLPLVMAVGEQLVPALAIEMLRVATGEPAIAVEVGARGVVGVRVADLAVPTQAGGDVWLHYARRGGAASRQVSAAAVLAGTAPPEALSGKLVLVGLTGSGLSDMRMTPLKELVPGIEIQAQAIESFFDNRFLLRPWWIKSLEIGLLGALGLVMIWLIPQTHSRVARLMTSSPGASSWLVMGLNVLLLALGAAFFVSHGLLFDAASLLIGFSAVLASLVSSATLEIDRENARLAAEQQSLREENARVGGELAAARQIQLASLPRAETLFAAETRFAVAALLEPAREVGGDLYDFFMLDGSHLFFVVGDVSGKGVPASLFMAVTKALTKSAARRSAGCPELAAVMGTVAREVGAENPESLFVTLVAGIYDADSGRLLLCNAGHDAPLCRRADGSLLALPGASGPPLCVLEGFPYAVEEFQLHPGDTLIVHTDGITDAADVEGRRYGSGRLRAALGATAADAEAGAILAALRAGLGAFVGAADAADDLTLLALRRLA